MVRPWEVKDWGLAAEKAVESLDFLVTVEGPTSSDLYSGSSDLYSSGYSTSNVYKEEPVRRLYSGYNGRHLSRGPTSYNRYDPYSRSGSYSRYAPSYSR